MPDFDPDAYLAAPAKFDPDQYLNTKKLSAPPAVLGALDTASFGLRPALAGLTEAAGPYVRAPDQAPDPTRPIVGGYKMAKDWLTGTNDPALHEAYEHGRRTALDEQEMAQKESPLGYGAGQVGGVLAGPAFGAARGVTALGRIAHGAAAGAIGSGLHGVGTAISEEKGLGDAALDVGRETATGAAFGTAGSGVLEALRPVGRKIAGVIRGLRDPDAEASRRIAQHMVADFDRKGPSLTPEEISAANAAGTPRSIIDAGDESVRALGRSAANTSPEARAALTEMTQARFEQQSPRIAGYIRQITGGGDVAGDLEKLEAAATRVNRPAYNKAFKAPGAAAMWDEGFEQIAQAPVVQDAIRKATVTGANDAARAGFTPVLNPFVMDKVSGRMVLRENADGSVAKPSLQFWDSVKKNLDKTGTREAKDFARVLREHSDQLVPEYKEARAGAASFFGAENALDAGHKFVQWGDNSPAAQLAARRAFGRMSDPEKQLFARGYASNLADMVEKVGDTQDVLKRAFLNNGPARDRTLMALGPENARKLEALLRAERIVDRARTSLGNSTTARQLAEMGFAGGATAGAEGLYDQSFNLSHVVTASILAGAVRHGAQVIDKGVARRVGELLASNDPAVLARGIQVATRNPSIFNALRAATSGVARGATAAEQPAIGSFVSGNKSENSQKPTSPGFRRGGRIAGAAVRRLVSGRKAT